MTEKIEVIFTGGTIGSLAEGDNISPDENAKFMLLNKYAKRTNESLDRFETISPLYILSENAVVEDVIKMANEIKKAEKKNVKGIIMTHGSDTLAFSAGYLGLLLPNIKVPVVLVASNLILTDSKANGVDNFITAVNLIDSNVKPNIYVAYKNPEDEYTSIHLGTRMCEPPPYSDNFYSPQGNRFGIYKNGKIILENTRVVKTDRKFKLKGSAFSTKALYVAPHTGLNYEVYKNASFDYVLHNLYHSGTANTREEKEYGCNNLLNFAEFCKNKNKPLYLCNVKKKDVNYESTNQMKEKNINFLYDILPNIALAKLNIAFNLIDETERNDYLCSNINGEILDPNIKIKSDNKNNNKELLED